jgi:phospholipid transport system substrate-binding protein
MRALNSRGKVLPLFAFLVLLLSFYSAAAADWPKAEIDFTVSQVIKILTDPMLKNREPERRKLLRETIAPQFDFRQMAKRSLGPYWRRQTSEQQNQFVRIFTELLEKIYLTKIESYHRDRFIYTGETISGDYAEVDSKIVTPRGREYSLDYLLYRTGNDWKIYDVIVDNVSLVNNYRSQFNDVIYRYSYQELVRRIEQKSSHAKSRG